MQGSALGVVADVHGNSWALRAVLEDLDRRGIRDVLNLGDCFYGPLDPGGTLELLRGRAWPTVRGNQDRVLIDEAAGSGGGGAHLFVLEELGRGGLEWVRTHTEPVIVRGDILACHGTPRRDDAYLAEVVTAGGVSLRTPQELDEALTDVGSAVVLCGHSHVPRHLETDTARLIVNPGSVGLPAYHDDQPFPHAMQSGSPHARYALLEGCGGQTRVSFLTVPYDAAAAAQAAKSRGRPDWARWLRSGRAP